MSNSRSDVRLLFVAALLSALTMSIVIPGAVRSSASDPAASNSRSVKKLCKAAGLKMPRVVDAGMSGPGIPRKQFTYVELRYKTWPNSNPAMAAYRAELPPACAGKFRRVTFGKLELQSHKNPRLWGKLFYAGGERLRVNIMASGHDDATHFGGEIGDATLLSVPAGHTGTNPNDLYRCTPGPRKTKVRAELRNEVRTTSGNVVAIKRRFIPVPVQGGGC